MLGGAPAHGFRMPTLDYTAPCHRYTRRAPGQMVVRVAPPGVQEGGRAVGVGRAAVGLRKDAVLTRHTSTA